MVLFHVLGKAPEAFYDLGKLPQFRRAVVDLRAYERAIQNKGVSNGQSK